MSGGSGRYEYLGPVLLVEEQGPVRVVTMNAPDRLNAVDTALHDALWRVWDSLVDDDEAGSVVLTGAGRAFCAGGYIPDFLRNHENANARQRAMRNAERLTRAMIQFELPVVAAVNGPAIGLGASLAVLCDLVVMADDAHMTDPHVTVGVVAGDGGALTWPLLMSLLRAKEHLLLGDRIDAAACERLGLANRVVVPPDVLPTAIDLAQRLAAQPRQALRDTKRALNLHLQQAADAVLSFAIAAERESFASEDVAATVARFTDGRRAGTTG